MKEKLQEYALIAEIISAVAIVVSLIFVGVQVRQGTEATIQNRDMMRAQIRNELAQTEIDFLYRQAGDPELTDLLVRSNRGSELTDVDRMRYTTRSEAVFRQWANIHYQYRQGLLDDEEFAAYLASWRAILDRNAGLVRYWCTYNGMFAGPFNAEMAGIITPEDCREHGL